jgi:isopenicillin N synthase-like dioxygenase
LRSAQSRIPIFLNLGDLMAEWTNDRRVSTLHRVRQSAARQRGRKPPLVDGLFPSAELRCRDRMPADCAGAGRPPRYGKTTSGEHVWMKINKHRTPELAQSKTS